MRKNGFHAICPVVLLYAVLELSGITCPIKFLTGISCAGCGMSRAWLSLFQGDFSAAFFYHPLYLLPIPMTVFLIFHGRLPRKVLRGIFACAAVLMLAVYGFRMLDPTDSVVVFAPEAGFLRWFFAGIW